MELTNTMVNIMGRSDRKADYDRACKNILSEKIILAWIMKSCLNEYQDCSILDIADKYIEEGSMQTGTVAVHRDEPDVGLRAGRIFGDKTEDFSETEGTVYFDVKFKAKLPGGEDSVGLIINIEAQKDFYPGYSLVRRGIFYCARMLSSQYETEFTGSQYQNIRKVYSVWICTNPSRKKENSIMKYSIREEAVAGKAEEAVSDYDLMTVVMMYLGKNSEEKILRLLHLLLISDLDAEKKLDILKRDYGICTSQALESEVKNMCNISEQIEERGIKKGIEQGIEQGKEQGILAAIESLMNNMKLSSEEAMKALSIPVSEWPKYIRLLKR